MKISCNIIQDLLPLYIDDVCTEESRELVEGHIQSCDKCRKKLELMKNPLECPQILEGGESKEPFKKIRKKARLHLIIAVLITIVIGSGGIFAVQEVGWLHDYFYPANGAVIDNEETQQGWIQVDVSGNEYLNFSSIFYRKKLINDANSSGSIVIRILDDSHNTVLEETTVEAGESISLNILERNKDYIVEVKCGEGRYFLNFV